MNPEIRRGQEAERLMNEPLIKEAFEKIESGVISALKSCAMADRDTQHELALTLQLLGKLQGVFKEIMQTGQLAQMQEESIASRLVRKLRA